MKVTSILAKACAAAVLCTGIAWAETSSTPLDSSKLDDKKITDPQGQQLGEIERLLVDPQTGQVRFAVVEVEKGPGQAETEVAVPWQALKVQPEGEKDFKIQLDATKDKLEKAPRFSEAEAQKLFTPEGSQSVMSYWSASESEASSQPPSSSTTTPPSTSGQQAPPSTSGAIGTQPESGQPSISTPSEQSPSTSTPDTQSSPSTTVPSPGASSPSDPSKEQPDISTSTPSAPSSPTEPSTIP